MEMSFSVGGVGQNGTELLFCVRLFAFLLPNGIQSINHSRLKYCSAFAVMPYRDVAEASRQRGRYFFLVALFSNDRKIAWTCECECVAAAAARTVINHRRKRQNKPKVFSFHFCQVKWIYSRVGLRSAYARILDKCRIPQTHFGYW